MPPTPTPGLPDHASPAKPAGRAAAAEPTGPQVPDNGAGNGLSRLLEAMVAIGPGPELHTILDRIAETAARLADCRYALIGVLAEDGRSLKDLAAFGGDPADRDRIRRLLDPRHGSLTALVGEAEPVRVADPAADPRAAGIPADHPLQRGFLGLPVRVGSELYGHLFVAEKRGEFTDEDVQMMRVLATEAGIAIDNARMHEAVADARRDRERLAVYEDRDRIARDLHDLVIQRLFATGLMLESAQRRSPPEVSDLVGRAVEELDATIQEIRTAIFALRQRPSETPTGLRTRVLREIGSAAMPLGFQPSVRFVGPVDARVGEGVARNLVAALREALSNAFRHARATRIEVGVDATVKLPDGRNGVRLTVADDGVGIPEGGRRSGLANLSRRAESLGGSCEWRPGLGEGGRGTTVIWQAPL